MAGPMTKYCVGTKLKICFISFSLDTYLLMHKIGILSANSLTSVSIFWGLFRALRIIFYQEPKDYLWGRLVFGHTHFCNCCAVSEKLKSRLLDYNMKSMGSKTMYFWMRNRLQMLFLTSDACITQYWPHPACHIHFATYKNLCIWIIWSDGALIPCFLA